MILEGTDFRASGMLMTLDGAQRRKEAHAILQAYECRHLKVKPYKGFPVHTTPDWEDYEPKMRLMTPALQTKLDEHADEMMRLIEGVRKFLPAPAEDEPAEGEY